MIKTLFKINIFTIFFSFILKNIFIFLFFYYFKIKSLNFLLIFFLPYFNNVLNMTFSNKLYEMLQIYLLRIFYFFNDLNSLKIYQNKKRKREKEDG